MHALLYNPGFQTIAFKTAQSQTLIRRALRNVKVLKAKIAINYGAAAAEKVVGPTFEHSLRRCLQYFTPGQDVTEEDYEISYLNAANAAMEADNVIAEEMPDL